jgi:ABC-2 type transport system permease protein
MTRFRHPALSIGAAQLRGFLRDRAAVAWTLAFPIALLGLFATLFSGDGRPGGDQVQQGGVSPITYLLPTILAMALMQLGVYSAISLVQQRERQILKRFASAPIDRSSIIGGFVGVRLLVAIVQALLLLAAGRFLLGVEVVGNPIVMTGVVLLTATTFIAIGFALAGIAKTEEAATQLTGFISLPSMFLSGLFVPVDQLPGILKPIASIMPLTYAADGLRQAMVGGTPFVPLFVGLGVLTAWLAVSLIAAVRLFRWQ